MKDDKMIKNLYTMEQSYSTYLTRLSICWATEIFLLKSFSANGSIKLYVPSSS